METFMGRNVERHSPAKVGKKIAHLEEVEGVPHKQAVAIALNMNKKGRLTKEGKYKHTRKQ